MSERTMWKGMVAEKKMERDRQSLIADGLIISLRTLINPHEEAEDLNIDLIFSQAGQLMDVIRKCRNLRAEILSLEKDLYG